MTGKKLSVIKICKRFVSDHLKVAAGLNCSGNANLTQMNDPVRKKIAISQLLQLSGMSHLERTYTVLYHKIELFCAGYIALAAVRPEITENAYEHLVKTFL